MNIKLIVSVNKIPPVHAKLQRVLLLMLGSLKLPIKKH